MDPFEHLDALTLSQAIKLLGRPSSAPLAGGTDLLGELKRGIRRIDHLINLKTIPGLNRIHFGKGLRIGGLTTLSELEDHPVLLRKIPILSQALSLIGTKQLRNMGTLAGNLCQHPRCWYYRDASFHCWLKGGKVCFAFEGENVHHAVLGASPCRAVHPSDLAPVLIALGAKVKISGPKGNRWIPLEDFFMEPEESHRQQNVLKRKELVTEIEIPFPPRGAKGIYLKEMERKAWSFAMVSAALCLVPKGERVSEVRLVLGGVAPIPWRLREAEELLRGERLSEGLITSAVEVALTQARALSMNGYKVPLAKALIKRALISVIHRK